MRKRSRVIGRGRCTPSGRRAQRRATSGRTGEGARVLHKAARHGAPGHEPRQARRRQRSTCSSSAAASTARSRPPRLSARGARVALIDRGDFAGFTSQQSSNLAWGGIKYMESLELGLVRKLCVSRNHLIRSYPSTVQEIRFYAAHERGFRHGLWKLVLGTWLYWLIGNFFTKRAPPPLARRPWRARSRSSTSTAATAASSTPTRTCTTTTRASSGTSSARALDYGCVAANYVESLGARREGDGVWVGARATCSRAARSTIRARVLVNACGPFVDAQNALAGAGDAHAPRVLEGHPPHRRPAHAAPARAHLLRRRRPPLLRHPDGPAHLHRHHRHARRQPRRRGDRGGSRASSSTTSTSACSLPRPLTEADVIAERCGVRPLAVSGEGRRRRLDAALAQARRRGRRGRRATSASSAAS